MPIKNFELHLVGVTVRLLFEGGYSNSKTREDVGDYLRAASGFSKEHNENSRIAASTMKGTALATMDTFIMLASTKIRVSFDVAGPRQRSN